MKQYNVLPKLFLNLFRLSLLSTALILSPAAYTASVDTPIQLKLETKVQDTKVQDTKVQDTNAQDANIQDISDSKVQDVNVWDRVRQGLRMDPLDSPLVEVHARWYADHPDYVNRMLERSRRYLYHIVSAVEERNMPMEIALLPMIESGFNPQALSRSHAAGIWQFVPATGKKYGLKQNTWYDGRRDITAATQAALDYLQKLFMDFGSWDLALAAYNCGEGCVSRAQQRNASRGLPTDYASLNLPVETKHYVPKLLAIKELIQEPESFGVELNDIPNEPYFTRVSLNSNNMDMRSAARLAGMSVNEFLSLNPAFPRRLIRSNSEVSVLVPVDKADQFQSNLQKGEWDSWQPYRARKGETVAALAKRFNSDVSRLSEHNNFKLYRGRFRTNQVVLVPVNPDSEAVTDKKLATWAEAEKHSFSDDSQTVSYASRVHVVRRGDTLSSVARKYRVSTSNLKRWNNLRTAHIKAGQRLTVKQASMASRTRAASRISKNHKSVVHSRLSNKDSGKTRYYTVRRGDTLSSISNRFNVALADIQRWNQIKGHNVEAGTKLVIKS
ncbi:MAG: LysM peptidoglycan-binding domain-containing protein [Thiobacillaceae bacterium]